MQRSLKSKAVLISHRTTNARPRQADDDEAVMKGSYIAERATLGAIDRNYRAVRNILKQPATMA
jgi:hypothetical protein